MQTDSQLLKRTKSFLWRLGMVTAVFVLEYVAANIGLLDLPEPMTLMIGLVAGEVSKYLNTKHVQA